LRILNLGATLDAMRDSLLSTPPRAIPNDLRDMIRSKLDDSASKLDEIERALAVEMAEPIQKRNTLVLAFLATQREKFAFAHAALAQLAEAANQNQEQEIAVGSSSDASKV